VQVSPLSERDNGPYPRDYSRAFAFCTILYPLVYAACCQTTSPLPFSVGGNRRAYPVQGATRGAIQPPVPLGPYFTPGERTPE